MNAYGFLHIFNIVILSETYLDSNILSEDANLEVQGYELIRTDSLLNFKRGGFCIYYTEEATEMAAKYLHNIMYLLNIFSLLVLYIERNLLRDVQQEWDLPERGI